MKIKFNTQDARESGLIQALVAWCLPFNPEADTMSSTADNGGWGSTWDGLLMLEDEWQGITFSEGVTPEDVLRDGVETHANGGWTPSLGWDIDGDVLSIRTSRHALENALYQAWIKHAPTLSPSDKAVVFRNWKAAKFGSVKPIFIESQEPDWAWFDTLDDHIVELADAAGLQLLQAEAKGAEAPADAVATLARLCKSAYIAYRSVDEASTTVLRACAEWMGEKAWDASWQLSPAEAFELGHAITRAQLAEAASA